jgi:hypothetical protein
MVLVELFLEGAAPPPLPPVPVPPAPPPPPLTPNLAPSTLLRFRRNIPSVYADTSAMKVMAGAVAAEWDLVYAALAEIQAQAFVLSATWGIQYWEYALALPSDPQVPLATRRAKVMAALSPATAVTLNTIKRYIAQFQYGTVEIDYVPQFWSLSVTFADFRGRPPNIESIQTGLDALVPAWLALNYVFRYTTYGELKRWGLTYGQIKRLGLTYGQLKSWAPSGAGASQPGNTAATFAQATGGLVAQTNSTAATFAQPSVTVTPTGGH